jgi:cytochrome c
MAGPLFYYDATRKYNLLSREDDHTLLIYDWMRGKIWKAKLSTADKLDKLEFLAGSPSHPMDMQMASDGSIYMLSYGSSWYFYQNGFLAQILPTSANPSPKIAIEPLAGKDRTFKIKSVSGADNEKITVTWWLTTGATEHNLSSGSTVTIPAGLGSEIRAVASDGKNQPAVARISLIQDTSLPSLTMSMREISNQR